MVFIISIWPIGALIQAPPRCTWHAVSPLDKRVLHGSVCSLIPLLQNLRLETDRPPALREAILACRNGGTLSIPGVYAGFLDKVPFGAIMNRALTVRTGQTQVQRYMRPLLER